MLEFQYFMFTIHALFAGYMVITRKPLSTNNTYLGVVNQTNHNALVGKFLLCYVFVMLRSAQLLLKQNQKRTPVHYLHFHNVMCYDEWHEENHAHFQATSTHVDNLHMKLGGKQNRCHQLTLCEPFTP